MNKGFLVLLTGLITACGADTNSEPNSNDAVNGDKAKAIADRLMAEGAVPVFVAPRLGAVASSGTPIQADASLEVAPSVVFDAMVLAATGVSSKPGD